MGAIRVVRNGTWIVGLPVLVAESRGRGSDLFGLDSKEGSDSGINPSMKDETRSQLPILGDVIPPRTALNQTRCPCARQRPCYLIV